jgi:hypothetical protein
MTAPDPAPLETLRAAAQAHVDASSLRRTAREIGMSPTGLRGFLEGAAPYHKTERKLRQWFLRLRGGSEAPEPPTTETAAAALATLVQHLAPEHRAPAAARVVELLRRRSRDTGAAVPEWIERLGDAESGR